MSALVMYPPKRAEPPQAMVADLTSMVAGSNHRAVESAPSTAPVLTIKYRMRAS